MEERNKTLENFIIENQNAFNTRQVNYLESLTLSSCKVVNCKSEIKQD
jgi:hypothetical protein